ncbi:BMP family ABC transporter substrate-binding protein [Myxococcus sp. MISCRS1]|jgi:basic membrane protein A|uniref:BMP family lipoprotein n=1 Tax=Myxococcus TaxID=32 RepID=UPI001CC17345|nr:MULTISPECIES: BMP family ABC transporter substrate-binding protein [Myxococcus]BDT36779.1 BMP family ABC transporter substrate-binding protein [Myxococcus sp. MH1]MBZ4394679.1 BMP family ABC transporter substrate-binding protein [Myxococcus sp. AS-1-15]MBZ4410151.1 BMP family ABC transporter substrate-binding protein [Myxococcus sp. XM-1-1-1]MCK8497145.1 BMP family ABC transporter substrate-binding protein [Myxococcus fulvus]MCY1001650.1 BMP family ABC transporter substrate-binding protein 
MMLRLQVLALTALLCACTKSKEESPPAGAPATSQQAAKKPLPVGLVIDVGGRGDHSFNDAALRGLELWAAGKRYEGGKYVDAAPDEVSKSLPAHLSSIAATLKPLPIQPVVLQSKAQEDYIPNLQLLVDRGSQLTIGNGYLLANAVRTSAQENPKARFLLIDSQVLDSQGKALKLPNVRTVLFKEHEGSFLVGALAGLVTKTNKVGFVGGIEVPLIQRFEVGYRAGVKTTKPEAAQALMSVYTGSFNDMAAGKQVAQDLIAKGADVIFHAAGSDGIGVIQAVKEARAAGKSVYAIGVDSDQSHVAPEAILTSMLKHTDLVVYQTAKDLVDDKFTASEQVLGIKENGVAMAEVRVDFPGKAEALQKVEALRQRIISGDIQVPSVPADLASFQAAAP